MNTAVDGLILCDGCGKEAYPSLNMNERMQLVSCCPACGREHPSQKIEQTAQPKPAKVVPIRDLQITTDPMEVIRNRLSFLDAELEKAAAYTIERRRLRRMLKAGSK